MTNHKPLIVVSGKDGQVGSELIAISPSYPQFDWLFLGRQALDLSSEEAIKELFEKHKPAYFINCAAYTAVDKAEEDRVVADIVNAEAVGKIANYCKKYDTVLLHLSTDYVFDGNGKKPYLPNDITNPVNYYGATKLRGEELALTQNYKTIIVRTAWVYSCYGKNFVKTMLRLMQQNTAINIVDDQIGSPTYARDLAVALMQMVCSEKKYFGIYHYTNKGVISWYEFAMAIKEMAKLSCTVHAIPSSQFPTPAKRPNYSVLDNTALLVDYHIHQRDWRESLQECLQYLQKIA